MRSALKAEFTKLLTVRSTYILTSLVLLAIAAISLYVIGYSAGAGPYDRSNFMADAIFMSISTFATFAGIIAILLVSHEYRYNTISYTLTAARSRLSVLAAKTIVVLAYTVIVGLLVTLVTYVFTLWGVALKGAELAPQSLPILELTWRYGAMLLGYALIGLLFAVLLRSVVVAIIAFLFLPTVEGILTLIPAVNADYLPFASLNAVATNPSVVEGAGDAAGMLSQLSPLAALGVFSVYLAVLGVTSAVLFVRRDAN